MSAILKFDFQKREQLRFSASIHIITCTGRGGGYPAVFRDSGNDHAPSITG